MFCEQWINSKKGGPFFNTQLVFLVSAHSFRANAPALTIFPTQIEGELFTMSSDLLNHSSFFVDMMENGHTGMNAEGSSANNPIKPEGITAFEMTSFLTFVCPR